jgi:hypothetical protein
VFFFIFLVIESGSSSILGLPIRATHAILEASRNASRFADTIENAILGKASAIA